MNLNTIDNNIDIRDRDNNWWGKLPIGWRVKKLKYISLIQLSNVDKLSVEGQEIVFLCNYTDVYKNEKIVSTLPFMQATATDEQIKRLSIQKSDVLLTKDSETPDDIGIPAIVAEEITGVVCGYHLALSRPNPDMVHSGFLFRAIQSQPIKRYFYVNSVGMTRYGLDKQAIAEIPIPLPSLSIQKTIAEYLDREIAHIDALIDTKKRLIELLEEKKRALITHTITSGINEFIPTVESGVEWVDRIPINWVVEPLFSTMYERKQINQGNVVDNVLSLSFGNIVKRNIESNFGLMPESFETYQIVYPGDIILRLTDLQNDKRSLRVGLVKENGIITSAYVCLQCSDKIFPEYAYYLLHTYDLLKVFYNFGGGVRQTMRFEDLRRLPLILPNMETQQRIVEFLHWKLPKYEILIEKLKTSLVLLYDKRSSLISEAVTGQIDIPEASCN